MELKASAEVEPGGSRAGRESRSIPILIDLGNQVVKHGQAAARSAAASIEKGRGFLRRCSKWMCAHQSLGNSCQKVSMSTREHVLFISGS